MRRRWRGVPAPLAAFAVGGAVLLLAGRADAGAGLAELLRGPDDFMRMVRVIDWLDGQAWGDPKEHRLNPPHGVSMHWSRLSDLPLATAILATEPWGGRERALLAAATVVPPLLGGAFLAVFFWAAAALVPGRRLLAPLLVTAALSAPLRQFVSGRVDHHGLQLLLLLLALGWLLRALPPGRAAGPAGAPAAGAAAAAGACLALSLAVGLETLPFAGAMTAVAALAWVWERVAGTVVAAFGGALAGAALALLPAVLPFAEWLDHPCDRLSLVHVALAGAAALVGGAAWAWERAGGTGRAGRMALVCGVGGGGLAAVAGLFPGCVAGPLADLDPGVRYWFERVSEARSLVDLALAEPGVAASYALLPAAALAFAARRFGRAPWSVPRGAAVAVLLTLAVAVMLWQVRATYAAGLLAALLLAVPAAELDRCAERLTGVGPRVLLRLAMPLGIAAALFGPVLVERALTGRAAGDGGACAVAPLLGALNDPAGLGARPRNVAAPIDMGPALLLFTGHRVLAAPYHRNVRGLVDNRAVFGGNPATAHTAIRERSVEVLVHCRRAFSAEPADRGETLDELLARNRPPPWLEQVAAGDAVRLYRVRPLAPAADAATAAPW